MTPFRTKNPLWLLIVPPLLSFALVSIAKPSGRFGFWIEISIFCLCSLVCGFALAFRNFKTFSHRLWGGLALSGSGFLLISYILFLGCGFEEEATPADREKAEIRQRVWVAKRIPHRDAQADASMLDLSSYYDELLPGTMYPNRHVQNQRPGTHVWDGIKFDARGMIGPNSLETNSIPVGAKCSELDFLIGGDDDPYSYDHSASEFVIYFENGDSETIPIVFGTDVSNSVFENGIVPTNAVVWGEITSTVKPPQPFFGFYIKRWHNPYPNEAITSIDYVPGPSGALVAITIQPITQSSN